MKQTIQRTATTSVSFDCILHLENIHIYIYIVDLTSGLPGLQDLLSHCWEGLAGSQQNGLALSADPEYATFQKETGVRNLSYPPTFFRAPSQIGIYAKDIIIEIDMLGCSQD